MQESAHQEPLPAACPARESDHPTKGEIMTDTTWAITRDSWWDLTSDTGFDLIWGG